MLSPHQFGVALWLVAHGHEMDANFTPAPANSLRRFLGKLLGRGTADGWHTFAIRSEFGGTTTIVETPRCLKPAFEYLQSCEYAFDSRVQQGRNAYLAIYSAEQVCRVEFARGTTVIDNPVNHLIDWCAIHAPLTIHG